MTVMVVVPELANAYGLHQALVLRQLHYWLQRATCFEGDVPWVYKTVSEWAEEFTWWSRSTVHKLLTDLAAEELIAIRSEGGRTYYTINYQNLRGDCQKALVMLSEFRTDSKRVEKAEPMPSSENRTATPNAPVMLSENQTEASEIRTDISEFRTPHNKEVTEITSESTNREGERAQAPPTPTVISSGVPGVRKLRLDSPYLKGSKFVNGFIPPGTGRNAVEVYYERFEIGSNNWRLTAPQEDDLVRQCKDLVLLREVVTAYDQANFPKPRNMRLIFDWYRDPSRFREGQNGQNRRSNQANYRQPEVAQFTTAERDTYNAQQIAAGRPF